MNNAASRSCATDRLARFVFEGAAVRGARVHLSSASADILSKHRYPAALARVIAELLAATTLMASTLKFNGSLIVQLQGDGPVRLLVVECDHLLKLRATAQWDAARVAALAQTAALADLAGGSTHARLVITLDPKGGAPLYQGIVALSATSVAALFEHYLATSEQLDSRLALATRSSDVAGILLQRLPGAASADDATWKRGSNQLAATSPQALFAAASSNEGLLSLFPGHDLRVFRDTQPRFECSCSNERVERALRIAGSDEIEAALAERGEVEVTCEFCNRRYLYGPDAARALFGAQARIRVPPTHR